MKVKYIILTLFFLIKLVESGITQKTTALTSYHAQIKGNSQSTNRLLLLQGVKNKEFRLVDSLCSKGFDINEPNVYGDTILGELLKTISDTSLIDSLLQRGACLSCGMYISQYVLKEGIESNYNEPLCNAMLNKDKSLFNFLLKKYKNLGLEKVLSKRELIETAIITINYRDFLVFSTYFDFKKVNEVNISGETLLTEAVESLAIRYYLLLIEGKNTESEDSLNEGIHIIEFLLSKGADINKLNSKGESILSELNNIPKLYNFLRSKGAK